MQQDADQHRKMMQRKTGHERENVKVSTTAALKM